MKLKSFLPAIAWFITSFILLTLPGDDLPKSHFFDIPFFDKYVHFGMFFLLTFLFCLPFTKNCSSFNEWKIIAYKIVVYAILYGVAMEFVQKYVVKTRSFDLVDILFDTIGSGSGFIGIRQYFVIKNRPR